jgi:hypothetical protein
MNWRNTRGCDRGAGDGTDESSHSLPHPEMSLGHALIVMLRMGLRHLVVVDGDGRCSAVLADRAVTAALAADPTALVWQCERALLDPRPAVVALTPLSPRRRA